jgi:hypothetical protein
VQSFPSANSRRHASPLAVTHLLLVRPRRATSNGETVKKIPRPIFSAISIRDFRFKIEGRACNRESEIDNQKCREWEILPPEERSRSQRTSTSLESRFRWLALIMDDSCAFLGQNSALAWIQLSVCFPESAT